MEKPGHGDEYLTVQPGLGAISKITTAKRPGGKRVIVL
jgi:hypothetical protein